MEKGYAGGPALARDVARIVALFIKMHPEIDGALKQHEFLLKEFQERTVVRASQRCTMCRFILKGARACVGCNEIYCLRCAPVAKSCATNCCFLIAGHACVVADCYAKVGCTDICQYRTSSKCIQCKTSMCETHICRCIYCRAELCEPCALAGHQDCERKKKFRKDDGDN